MSAREAYIAARSGAPRSSRPSAPKSGGPAGGPTREQKAFDAGQQERQREVKVQENKKPSQDEINQQDQSIVAKIGHGDIEQGYIGDEAFKKTVPAGQHKLRTQYDRLLAKYGDDFAETSQAKVLANYLSGVPVERGGGLGARDPDYGGGEIPEYDQAGNFITKARRAEAEAYRKQQLGIMGLSNKLPGFMNTQNTGFNKDNFNFELARLGLSPEQYQNYIRQLIAADPRQGNTLGKENFGNPLEDILAKGMQFVPGIGALSRILPKADLTESQAYGEGNKLFYDTSVPTQDRSGGAGIPSLYGGPITQDYGFEDKDKLLQVVLGYGPMDRMNYTAVMPREGYQYSYDQQGRRYEIPIGGNQSGGTTYGGNPFTFREGRPNIPPMAIGDKFKTGVASLAPTTIDYASMGPQYGGYVNQGISDPRFASYLQNLQMFPRRS